MSCPHGEWHDEDCELCQKDARIYELECQVERLRVCGNCKNLDQILESPKHRDDCGCWCLIVESSTQVHPHDSCRFVPSRWDRSRGGRR